MNFHNVDFLASYLKYDDLPPPQSPEIVFSGHSNVGKSSLINKIFGRKSLARVSATPGKTTAVNFFRCENLIFADLPGYGYAKAPKFEQNRWKKLINVYLHSERDIALIMQLIDIRHKPTAEDIKMIDYLIESETPFIIIFTKADKLSKTQRAQRMESFSKEIPQFEDIKKIEFSAITGQGADEIREILSEMGEENALQ
jgi:GTP-binding protein